MNLMKDSFHIQFNGTPRRSNPRRPSRTCCKALSRIRRPKTIQGATSEPDPKGEPPNTTESVLWDLPTSPLQRGKLLFMTPDCKRVCCNCGNRIPINVQHLKDPHLPRMPLRRQILGGYHQKLQNQQGGHPWLLHHR